MEFHPNKCQVLRVTNKRNIIDAEFHIHGTSLQVVHRAKYLRITTDKQLSWKDHIGSITVSAQSCRHFLQRNLHKCDKETKIQCIKLLLGP